MSRNRNRRRTEVELATTPSDQARPVTRRGTIQDLWWLIFGGCLTFLAFPYRTTPDSEIWPLAWVGLVPLLWTLQGVTPRRALFYGALCGFVINFGGFWWMSGMFEEFGHLPAAVAWGLTILNAFYQGLLIALFSYAVVWLGRRHHRLPGPLVIASAFTAIEYLFPMVFPWYYGNSQHPFRTFVQVADLAGVYGVSFLVVLGNALIASGFGRLRGYEIHRIQAGVGVGLLALAIGYGVVRLGEVDAAAESAPTLKIGMVEADIGIWEKEAKGLAPDERRRTLHSNLLKHQEMSRDLARRGAELILWPESSYLPLGPVYGKRTDAFAAGIGPGGRLALWRDLGDAGFDWSLGPVLNTSGGPMRALAAARENAMCAVGDNGYAAYWDGRRLTRLPIQLLDDSPPPALLGVAVGAPAGLRADADGVDPLIWAVGERGHAYTGDLHGLDLVATELSTALRGVVTIGQGRALAVGDRGVILALEGRAHTRVETNSQADLHAIAFDSQDKVLWAVGAEGTILTARGANWSRERSGVTSLLRSVTVTPEGVVYAVGDHGTVLRRDRSGSWIQEALSTKSEAILN